MKVTSILFALFLVISCSKYEEVDRDCLNSVLNDLEMEPYTGQEIGCEFFLELYRFKNKNYFLLGSHCADLASYPFDCDGNQLCDDDDPQKCNRFYEKAENLGVVGISKPVNE